MLGPQPPHVVPEPRDRPDPADPLRDHRRRHLRMLGKDRSHPPLKRRERRRHHRALVLRRPIRGQRTVHCCPPDPQLPSDPPPRNPIRDKPPNQRPVLHRNHPSNLSGWPRFRPSLWPRFQTPSTIRLRVRIPPGRAWLRQQDGRVRPRGGTGFPLSGDSCSRRRHRVLNCRLPGTGGVERCLSWGGQRLLIACMRSVIDFLIS